MRIRLQIIIASIAYLAIIIGIGWFSYNGTLKSADAINDLSTTAINMYDKAFVGVDYAHKVQTLFVRFMASHEYDDSAYSDDASKAQIQTILDNMDVVIERSMSEKNRNLAKEIRTQIQGISKLDPGRASSKEELQKIDKGLTRLVDKFSAGGFEYRAKADDTVDASARQVAATEAALKIVIGIAIGVAIVVTIALGQSIVPPLRRAVTIANAIAEGRLDNKIQTKGHSETARLLSALSIMQTAIANNIVRIEEQAKETERRAIADSKRKVEIEAFIKDFEQKIDKLMESLITSSSVMQRSTESMINDLTNTDANLQRTISSTSDASANVSAVAAAAEELSASISEISSQVMRSASISKEAVEKTQAADKTIQQLSQSAERINEVTSLISKITSQINLLALNATIEAARAGEAGKGFAVVAAEVKTLASQTAQATEAISGQIGDMQKVVRAVIDALTSIRTTINEMEGIATNVSSAIEEQGAATSEIARNIQMTSSKVHEVSGNISEVGSMSQATRNNSQTVLKSTKVFYNLSEDLSREIDTFLKKVA